MMAEVSLTLHRDKVALFSFLPPTRAYKQGDYFKFCYWLPFGYQLTSYRYQGLMVTVTSREQDLRAWELIRDYQKAMASPEVLQVLSDLEMAKLQQRRRGDPLQLTGWVFERVAYGISDREDATTFARLLFLHGYEMEEAIELFSNLARGENLSRPFLEQLIRLYGGNAIG